MTKNPLRSAITIALVASAGFSAPVMAGHNAYTGHWHGSGPQQQIEHHNRYKYAVTSRQTLSIDLKQQVRNDTLPLRRMFGLDRSYRGRKLEKVIVHLQPHRTKGKLKLLVNGRAVDRELAMRDRTIELDPRRDLALLDDIRSLQLHVDGKVLIRRIELELKSTSYQSFTRSDHTDGYPYRPIHFGRESHGGHSINLVHDMKFTPKN